MLIFDINEDKFQVITIFPFRNYSEQEREKMKFDYDYDNLIKNENSLLVCKKIEDIEYEEII